MYEKMLIKTNGTVKIEFILCNRRKMCATCPNHGGQCLRERREVRLMDDVWFLLRDGRTVYIRGGFVFDGASIPRLGWRVIGHPLDPEFIRSALLHDGLYAAELLPRKECDKLFVEAMADVDDIGWLKRNTIYGAVRIGGGAVWANHSADSVAVARKYVAIGTQRVPALPLRGTADAGGEREPPGGQYDCQRSMSFPEPSLRSYRPRQMAVLFPVSEL